MERPSRVWGPGEGREQSQQGEEGHARPRGGEFTQVTGKGRQRRRRGVNASTGLCAHHPRVAAVQGDARVTKRRRHCPPWAAVLWGTSKEEQARTARGTQPGSALRLWLALATVFFATSLPRSACGPAQRPASLLRPPPCGPAASHLQHADGSLRLALQRSPQENLRRPARATSTRHPPRPGLPSLCVTWVQGSPPASGTAGRWL